MNHAEKKERIIEAAAKAFSTKGFHQAKMDQIAQDAGVAKGTLYYNFASKSKLFAATVTHGLNQIMAAVDQTLVSDQPFPQHFHTIVATLIRLYVANAEVTRIYANELSSGIDPGVLQEIRQVRSGFQAFLEQHLKTGQQKGYLRPMSPRLAALTVTGIIDAMAGHHLEHPTQDDLDQIIETVFTILSSGMLVST